MFGILSAIVGLGLRGVCGVHNYIDNQETMKRTAYKTYNGNTACFGRGGTMYVNGEQVYRKFYRDVNGKEHHMEVGMHSGRVYSDSFEQKAMEDDVRNQKEKQKRIAQGYKAYCAYHPNTRFTVPILTEISTGKVIASLVRYQDGRCFKEYADLSKGIGNIVVSDEIKIPITSREFDELNVMFGRNFVYDKGTPSDFKPNMNV